ncbi:hypothetical protein ACFQXB_11725 [Plastorhodobacter daqingensis]|uniref:Phosphoadenosine phosphosulphate reductase domain-containing protein n=1 Tax=Plastorhodobacter daqingensis TaxID=1387281 RepID=A0ABW2UNI0_9RHOB
MDLCFGDRIVVWFSNGAASAVAWYEAVRRYGDICEVVAVNNPVAEEDEDNKRFAQDVARWVGGEIVFWCNPKFSHASAVQVWDHKKAMSFPRGAPCTDLLKKAARQDYERHHRVDWHVFGFTSDEKARHDRFVLTERENVLPVLIEADISKDDCYQIVHRAGLVLPLSYRLGYPNANCIGCVKATSATYWNHVRQVHPEVFRHRAEQSRRLGVRLVRYKGERIFLDELPVDAVGRPMKTMRIECGVFCEEWSPNTDSFDFPINALRLWLTAA